MPESQQYPAGGERAAGPVNRDPLPAYPTRRANTPTPHARGIAPSLGSRTRAASMDLPRGKFRALIRRTGLLFLIKDLQDEGFTGYCQVQHQDCPLLIVFREGKILLAGYDGLAGNRALDAINIVKYTWVDAMLHELDENQIQLAIEFNPSWRIHGYESSPDPGQEILARPADQLPSGLHSPLIQALQSDQVTEGIPEREEIPDETACIPSSAIPEEHPNPPLTETGEQIDWRAALLMPVLPEAEAEQLATEDQNADQGRGDMGDRPGMVAISFEPLLSGSELFERERKKIRAVATRAVHEPGEQWRSMAINRQPNTTV